MKDRVNVLTTRDMMNTDCISRFPYFIIPKMFKRKSASKYTCTSSISSKFISTCLFEVICFIAGGGGINSVIPWGINSVIPWVVEYDGGERGRNGISYIGRTDLYSRTAAVYRWLFIHLHRSILMNKICRGLSSAYMELMKIPSSSKSKRWLVKIWYMVKPAVVATFITTTCGTFYYYFNINQN